MKEIFQRCDLIEYNTDHDFTDWFIFGFFEFFGMFGYITRNGIIISGTTFEEVKLIKRNRLLKMIFQFLLFLLLSFFLRFSSAFVSEIDLVTDESNSVAIAANLVLSVVDTSSVDSPSLTDSLVL